LLNCHRNIIWLGCFNKAGTLLRPQVARKNPGAFAQNLGEAGGSFLLFAVFGSLSQWLSPASRACALNHVLPGVSLRSTPGSTLTPAIAG
jgi:hypothetical protein